MVKTRQKIETATQEEHRSSVPEVVPTDAISRRPASTPTVHRSSVSGMPLVLAENWETLKKVAQDMQGSGIFPDTIKTTAQAAVILLACHELEVPFTQGARMIDIIYGRIALRGQLVGALLRSKGCKVRFTTSNEKVAVVEIVRPDDPRPFEYKVTFEEASALRSFEGEGQSRKAIPLTDKYNWKQMPRVMLQRFCLKQAANVHCEDMIMGLYSDDEVEMMEPSINVTAVPAPSPTEKAKPANDAATELRSSIGAPTAPQAPPVASEAPTPEQPQTRKKGLF